MRDQGFAELVNRAGQGDNKAARYLIERYESAIRRQIRLTLMDNKLRRVIEESAICQSMMGRLLSGLGTCRLELEGPEQLIALLNRMIASKITDQARYRRDCPSNSRPGNPSGTVEPSFPGTAPGEMVENRDYLAELERRLSDWERTIFAYRRQGMDWSEISDRTGGEPEAIRKRFERAVDRVGRSFDVIA